MYTYKARLDRCVDGDTADLEIDLGFPIFEEESIELRGPNFEINTRQENSIPSEFKSYWG